MLSNLSLTQPPLVSNRQHLPYPLPPPPAADVICEQPLIKTVRTVCPSRISPYDLSKLLCLFPYTICLPYDMSADREKKILCMTLISTPPEGAGASESESLFSLVLRRLLAAWRKRLAAFNGKGLFTYYVSRNWGLSDPPSPLRQQLSAFTVPPPPPPAAAVM